MVSTTLYGWIFSYFLFILHVCCRCWLIFSPCFCWHFLVETLISILMQQQKHQKKTIGKISQLFPIFLLRFLPFQLRILLRHINKNQHTHLCLHISKMCTIAVRWRRLDGINPNWQWYDVCVCCFFLSFTHCFIFNFIFSSRSSLVHFLRVYVCFSRIFAEAAVDANIMCVYSTKRIQFSSVFSCMRTNVCLFCFFRVLLLRKMLLLFLFIPWGNLLAVNICANE